MHNKYIYLKALLENNGKLNEIDLGEKIGFDENETRIIITQLLSEYKIQYVENGACNYSIMKTKKHLFTLGKIP